VSKRLLLAMSLLAATLATGCASPSNPSGGGANPPSGGGGSGGCCGSLPKPPAPQNSL